MSARDALHLLAASCDKLADATPGYLESTRRHFTTGTSDYTRAFMEDYCADI
jgi:hypothetical protein